MRNAFAEVLEKEAKNNPCIYLLVADLGFSIFDKFKKKFPKQFINLGIAEANMVGVAAGLALCDKIAFVYTIAPFVTARSFEQIRLDICYQNVNVKIVGVGAGLAYGALGPTHHAIEDISVMRSLPNMTVICPADRQETRKAVKAALGLKGPVYLRLVKGGEPDVYLKDYKFSIGKAVRLVQGRDITIMATGGAVYNCLKAVKVLETEGIKTSLINFHTIKPIDKEAILKAAADTKAVMTVEEHSIIGGLGSAVAEVLAENFREHVLFKRLGIQDTFCRDFGSHAYLLALQGLSGEGIAQKAIELLRTKSKKT